eukprot:TRINITY_DN4155_c0_g2_i3.p2 TRINITY_DN4155_c0_g2~~TRINITY_DN4155_c0_g2_i3.p2  ORF type:complete len:147 (-),score=42.42 TRINITY_DN4155_c0_g2_i3:9-449(-)
MCIRDRYQRRVHGEKKILISNLCYTIDFMDLIVQQLVSQGIDKELAEKAYNQCKSKDLTSIIKWITEYQEKQAIEMSIQDNYGQQNQNVEGNQNLDKKEDNNLSLIHISEPTRLGMISYAVFCLKKKKKKKLKYLQHGRKSITRQS